MPHLAYAIDDGLATLAVNNPQQNRTDSPTATELAETLEAIGRSSARAVLGHAESPEFQPGRPADAWTGTAPSGRIASSPPGPTNGKHGRKPT
ncbi:hypothetical protein ACWKT5_22195 [Streptomyces avermitilis]